MTMPVMPFPIPLPNVQGESIAPAAVGGANDTFGSLLSSALNAPTVTLSIVSPNAGLSATSLASVPIVAAAVSLGTISGDPVAFVSDTHRMTLELPAGHKAPAGSDAVPTPPALETTEAASPIAADGSSAPAFVPLVPGSTLLPAEAKHSPPAAATSTSRPELQRVFADRLERVIDRMESEFGYRVEVVETVRTQSRQDALYAQGRERAGPVVTWTRNSRHTEGCAADVMIDGSYGNAAAYRVLSKVAREEGLRTLGPRDPGHLELPRTTPLTTAATEHPATPPNGRDSHIPVATREPARTARLRNVVASYRSETSRFQVPQHPAPVASDPAVAITGLEAPLMPAQARIEPVAVVATVATVAQVAIPGRAQATSAPNAPSTAKEKSAVRRLPERPLAGGDSRAIHASSAVRDTDSTSIPVEPTLTSGEIERDRQSVPDSFDLQATDFGPQHLGGVETPAQPLTEVARSTTERTISPILSERIAELLNLRDAAAERPLSSVLLRLDSPDGTEDRIRIGLRGSSLDAAFEMSDRALVDDLNRHVSELARAVERQGLEPEHLVARSSSTKDPVLAQAAAGERDGLRAANAGSTNSSTTGNREGRNSRHDGSQEHPPRHRPRRDPHGDQ